ncbi:MAG: hypothetical protein JKX78_10610 [Alteromonadaceae bacterium]|nr:hypothetical protein [Alteromonadaceae bacterium]
MKERIFITLTSILIIGLSGCDIESTPNKKNTATQLMKKQSNIVAIQTNPMKPTIKELKKSRLKDNKKKRISSNLRGSKLDVFLINNEKFTSKSTRFAQGERLYNLTINQFGTIKGSIVIVLNESVEMSAKVKQLGEVSKIASDTYRIKLPINSNVLAIYQQLKKTFKIKIVEMEIDYTPKNNREVM